MSRRRSYNLSYADMVKMGKGSEKAIQYAVSGLLVDGAHHKQWCLEQVLIALGVTPHSVRKSLQPDYDFEDGIPP